MQKTLVYDFPTRLFHLFFGTFFIIAFIIAKNFRDDSPWFAFHSLCGFMVGGLVVVRVLWGLFGTRHARFTGFSLRPSEIFVYFGGILTGSKRIWAGHNPASSWSALLMFVFALLLVATGTQMTSGSEVAALKDVHELIAHGFMVVTVLHIAGVILHSFRHRDAIALSMVTGKKEGVAASEGISGSKPGWALVLLAVMAAFGFYLYGNYDAQKGTLHLFGMQLQLLEVEEGEGEANSKGQSGSRQDSDVKEGREIQEA
jgi:cytochrome b